MKIINRNIFISIWLFSLLIGFWIGDILSSSLYESLNFVLSDVLVIEEARVLVRLTRNLWIPSIMALISWLFVTCIILLIKYYGLEKKFNAVYDELKKKEVTNID